MTGKRWDNKEIELLEKFLSKGMTHIEISNILGRTHGAVKGKALRLKAKSLNNVKKTTKVYKTEIIQDIEVLEEYINDSTKILHKHVCGYEWLIKPNDILNGHSCPKCAITGFNPEAKARLYVISFPGIENLYKVGVSNNYTERIKSFGIHSELVYVLEFETGKEALEVEKQYLNNVKEYLVNTGKLRSGNTETFRYK